MRNAAIAVFMLVATTPALGDQSPIDPKAMMRFGALRGEQSKNPYQQLFEAREALRQALADASQHAAPAPKKKIVCGMTVIEVGPEIDPKMGVTPPKDDRVRYTIRAIEPPVCNASTAK
jgi:hypothetical protein